MRHKGGRGFLFTQVLALLGDHMVWLAMGIWVMSLTGSSAAAGLTFFAFTAPQLLSPFSGVIVDRFRRRSILIGCSLVNAAAMVPLLWVSDAGDIALIYAVMICYGTTYTLLMPAQSAYLATVLPDDLLPAGNSFLHSVREGLRIFAPLLGATLFAMFGGTAIVIINIAIFLSGAAMVSRLRTVEKPPERGSGSLRVQLGAGIRHLRSVTSLRQVTIALTIVMSVVGFIETLVYDIVDTGLHRPSSFVGVVAAIQGAGAIVAGLLAPRLMRWIGERATAGLGMVMLAASCPLLAVPVVGTVSVGMATFGAGIPWLVVGALTLLQRRTPTTVQGRVFAAVNLVTSAPQALSIAGGAALITVLGYRALLLVMCTVILLAAAYLLTRRPDPTSSAAADDENAVLDKVD